MWPESSYPTPNHPLQHQPAIWYGLSMKRQWHPTPALLPGKSHGWKSLVGCSPWGREESDTTEWLHFHFSLSCIGEGNGNPLQYSCLENPRDGEAWWAAVYGVAQSWTRLKRLSSSSIREKEMWLTVRSASLQLGDCWRGTRLRTSAVTPGSWRNSVSALKGVWNLSWVSQHLSHSPRVRTQLKRLT